MKTIKRLIQEQDGTTVPEYALITGIIGFTTLAAMIGLGVKFLVLMASTF